MKKLIVIILFATTLLSVTGTTQARDSDRGHRNNHNRDYVTTRHHNKHARKQHRKAKHHYARANRHNDYRYNGRHHNRYGNNHNRHYRHGRNEFRDGLKYAAGALVLGSVIHAINNNPPRRTAYQSAPTRSGHNSWYRVDSDGQCVEVRLNRQGNEVWTYSDSSNCY